VCSSDATFSILESFCSIFIKLKAECDADSVFVQVCHFLFMPEFQMDEHRLGISTRPYSEITCAKAQKGSDSAHCTVSSPSNGILCYKQLCHLAVSPKLCDHTTQLQVVICGGINFVMGIQ